MRGMTAIIGTALAGTLLLGACATGGSDDSSVDPAAQDAADGQGQGTAEAPHEDRAADEADGDVAGFTGAGADISESVLRRRIRRAEIDLVVEDGSAALGDIRRLAQRSGGFVDSADLREPDDQERGLEGTIVIRVPAEGLDDVLAELAALGVEEPATRISTEDVTEEFIDLEARLRNLQVLEAELQELLAEVRESGDPEAAQLFTVFDRLRQVRDEIEQIEGRRRLLEEQVTLSTVTIHLEQQPQPAAVPGDPWRPEDAVADATSTLVTIARAVGNVAIWVAIVGVPLALAVAIPAVAVAGARRRWSGGDPTPSS